MSEEDYQGNSADVAGYLIPGQKWESEINKAIKGSSYFLALLSSNSLN